MNIFVFQLNPFSQIGGGESFYRNLVLSSPNDHFYFIDNRKNTNNLPPNVTLVRQVFAPLMKSVRFSNRLDREKKKLYIHLNPEQRAALRNSISIAKTIKNLQIDHVHIPEYQPVGSYLKAALKNFAHYSPTTSTFIHGGLSQTLKFKAEITEKTLSNLLKIENQQRQEVDQTFAFMHSNLSHIETLDGIKFIDPILMVRQKAPEYKTLKKIQDGTKPRLIIAGRYEPVKGFERIINLYPYLSNHFSGIELWNNSNTKQELLPLQKMAHLRNMDLKVYRPNLTSDFFNKFPNNGILIFPSLFDSFNLLALEAITKGLPILISKHAGMAQYLLDLKKLSENYIFDPESPISTLDKIRNAAVNFQETKIFAESISKEIGLKNVYIEPLIKFNDIKLKENLSPIEFEFKRINFEFKNNLVQLIPIAMFNQLSQFKSRLKNVPRRFVENAKFSLNVSTKMMLNDYLKWIKIHYGFLKYFPLIRKVDGYPIVYGRNITFSTIRDFALIANDFKVALTYELRLIREQSDWSNSSLELATLISRRAGEEKVVELLQNNLNQSFTRSRIQFQANVMNDAESLEKDFENKLIIASEFNPILEIIVSSYLARNKIAVFLEKLSESDLIRNGKARLIFVDAASPQLDFEYAHLISQKLGIGITSFQMKKRVTIQEAWNFGIVQSSAPFLVFLGTDEAVFPNNFTKALELFEKDEELDWITFSSFASEVESEGNFISDKMTYNRSNFKPSLQYLDSSYVNFVGGVLRRSIFDRFGLFDASYKGAGDTEFKSRIFPYINVACSAHIGGQFLDYPEMRTTASMTAEIEDFSAWYIFRSKSALQDLTTHKPDALLEIYENALSYRKSYASHNSSDIFLAGRVLEVYKGYDLNLAKEVLKARTLYQRIFSARQGDFLKTLFWTVKLAGTLSKIRINDECSGINKIGNIRLDNSLEQHGWIW